MEETSFFIKSRLSKSEYETLIEALRFYGYACFSFTSYEGCENCEDIIHKLKTNSVMICKG